MLWEHGVVGSNPAIPTIFKPDWSNGMTGVSKTLSGGSIPSSGAIIRFLSISVSTLACHAGRTGSIPVGTATLWRCVPSGEGS